MSRKGESVTLSLSAEDKERLEAIALEFNCTWGSNPNISKLMAEIAQGKVLLYHPDKKLTDNKSKRGRRAIAAIIKALGELSLIWFG